MNDENFIEIDEIVAVFFKCSLILSNEFLFFFKGGNEVFSSSRLTIQKW